MEVEIHLEVRVKELAAKKKKLVTAMKRAKRTFVKSRVEKAKVDAELKKLKAKASAISKMTTEEARAHILSEMDSVTPENIYPRDLEREFERIDKPRGKRPVNEREVMDLAPDSDDDDGGYTPSARHMSDDAEGKVMAAAAIVGDDEEENEEDEVIDLSNE